VKEDTDSPLLPPPNLQRVHHPVAVSREVGRRRWVAANYKERVRRCWFVGVAGDMGSGRRA
jgi:hypothetical protein